MNCVIIPIIANYFIKNSIYSKNGLVGDVFLLGMTNSLLSPIARGFDVLYYFKKFYSKWKLKPYNKLNINQYELNEIC